MESDLSKITVKISDENKELIGTGLLIKQENIKNYIYFVTAAHCFYEDGDAFSLLRKTIFIELKDDCKDLCVELQLNPIESLISHENDSDIGMICIPKSLINIDLPNINIIKKCLPTDQFLIKGFPQATKGLEIDTIFPIWKQELTTERFNLTLIEDYTSFNVQGFSGSGIYVKSSNEIQLLGIFTRFRSEEKGKVIYCQYIETLDCILNANYLPALTYSYIAKFGITKEFFMNNIEKSIINLGERYNSRLNFKLPIVQRFNELSKDKVFKSKLIKIFDEWLTDRDISRASDFPELQKIETDLKCLSDNLIEWEKQNPFDILNKLELIWFFEGLDNLDDEIDNLISKLYDLIWKENKNVIANDSSDKKDKNPYEKLITRLRAISRKNYQLKSELDAGVNLDLVNNPFLIINGSAGCGKSHLLGDIATERLNNNLPTLLLLGQHFNSTNTIERNILDQLDLSCTFSNFLSILNNIGEQIDSRILIMIDALNETTQAEKLWKTQILGFLKDVSKYPFIGVVCTIRDTYFEHILPAKINEYINVIKHEAFKGNEYEALKLFCNYYGLEQPNIPILSYEFTNPLFLKLCCSGISNSGEKIFPSGFNGISKVFEYYINSIYSRISHRPEYKLRKKIIWDAINLFSKECIKKNDRHLDVTFTVDLFTANFPNTPYLLVDLIEEGLLIKSITRYFKEQDGQFRNGNTEIIYFAYERLGDFLIANYELECLGNIENIKLAFQEGGKFGDFLEGHHYDNDGVLEAFSVILPEKYSVELFELSGWLFEKYFHYNEETETKDKNNLHHLKYCCEYLNDLLLKSLKWRSVESIDDEKITNYFLSKEFQIQLDYEFYLNIILELSCIEGHPMNSDRLFRILSRPKMADRDAFWQKFLINHCGKNDDGSAQSIKRLLDFAWQPQISEEISGETCRLIGQTLIWVLATTNNELRDQVTKALVNLLEQKPLVLLQLLKKFKSVNDLYILERLYAIAYGVVLRTNSDSGVKKLAQYTYNTIFIKGKPPTHILLRDYARNIIEYALYKNLRINCIVTLIRPPYKSIIPYLPGIDEVKKYDLDHESPEFKKDPESARLFCAPYYSTLSWGDFGRKIVDGKIDDFYPISFTRLDFYKSFIKNLSGESRMMVKLYVKNIVSKEQYERNDYYLKRQMGDEKFEEYLKGFDEMKIKIKEFIKHRFNDADFNLVENEVIPYLLNEHDLRSKFSHTKYLNPEPFKRWIVDRVHKLGYDIKKHGHYDMYYTKFTGQDYSHKVERISKKYQWIAFYEIMAIISDNYKMRTGVSRNNPYEYYKGAWQNYLRDIDPAYVTKNIKDEFFNDDEVSEIKTSWTDDEPYKYWDNVPSEWVNSLNDLPKLEDVIVKKDEGGNFWLHLQKFVKWIEPKTFGQDKYDSERKEFWYKIQGYICKKTDKNKITKYLQSQNLYSSRMPENEDSVSTLINREKFWSPADLDENKRYNQKEWVNVPDKNYKIIIATTGAKGSMEDDKSGANMMYNIPCKTIFEDMKLKYSSKDGDFIDENDEITVTNPTTVGTLIRRDKLLAYLNENDLEIFWTVSAEKNAKLEKGFTARYLFGIFSGVFFLENKNLVGSLNINEERKNF